MRAVSIRIVKVSGRFGLLSCLRSAALAQANMARSSRGDSETKAHMKISLAADRIRSLRLSQSARDWICCSISQLASACSVGKSFIILGWVSGGDAVRREWEEMWDALQLGEKLRAEIEEWKVVIHALYVRKQELPLSGRT